MRFIATAFFACTVLAAAAGGCATHQTGPIRPITLDDDVAWTKEVLARDLDAFAATTDPRTQATLRNRIVTWRMFLVDVQFHQYESRLTQELQDEGLAATATNLALTTSSTLIPVAQTKTLLSGLATGVTGLDKGYYEKELLSHTIQALQTQMEADRKEQWSVIHGHMFTDAIGTPTSITAYPLATALSDVDAYYQKGTIASALIGLSQTVAKANKDAEDAKAAAGANPERVLDIKQVAKPSVLTSATASIPAPFRTPVLVKDGLGPFEQRLRPAQIKELQSVVCVPQTGTFSSTLRDAVIRHLGDKKDQNFPGQIVFHDAQLMQDEFRAIRDKKQANPCLKN